MIGVAPSHTAVNQDCWGSVQDHVDAEPLSFLDTKAAPCLGSQIGLRVGETPRKFYCSVSLEPCSNPGNSHRGFSTWREDMRF